MINEPNRENRKLIGLSWVSYDCMYQTWSIIGRLRYEHLDTNHNCPDYQGILIKVS